LRDRQREASLGSGDLAFVTFVRQGGARGGELARSPDRFPVTSFN
jgi:hypothetical protein